MTGEIVQAEVRSEAAVPSSPQAVGKHTPHILVVDDERLIRWCLRQGLRRDGFEVDEAADGHTALRLLRDDPGRFAGVLLDYRLPDRHDLSLLQDILKIAPHIPVLMMTALAEPAMRADAIACGALGVIDKPFDVAAVIARLRSALEPSH